MDNGTIVHESELNVLGTSYSVQVCRRDNGKYFVMTRFSTCDAIITDGATIGEALERHLFSLPIAVSCRGQRFTQAGMTRSPE
jgi:hypothetical protein